MATSTHFHSSDERFCGSKEQARQFSFDENEITCQHCKDKDRLELSEQGRQFLRDLGEAA